jgi:hypothetical protein
MNKENKFVRNLPIWVGASIIGLLGGLLGFYGGIYLSGSVMPISNIPLTAKIGVLALCIFFYFKMTIREKKSREVVSEDTSRSNIQKLLGIEFIMGILAGLCLMCLSFIVWQLL